MGILASYYKAVFQISYPRLFYLFVVFLQDSAIVNIPPALDA